MPRTQHTFCRICEALCGLEVSVEGGRVAGIRPDAAHVATAGFACPKGLHQHHIYDSPDRLRRPLERRGETWREVSWRDALRGAGEKIAQLRRDYGPDSIAMYVGTAAGFGVLHPIFAQGFMTGLGSRSMYSSATQDCSNKFAVARAMYGFPFLQPFPDIDRTECLIVVGANPVVSKWSFLQVPNPARRLKAIEARGGKLWFVDPRRTESAKVAGRHVFIRPGTDVFFFAAFLHELIASGGIDHERVGRWMTGFEELARVVEPWSPERSESVTAIAAATVREMVGDYRKARGAALYSSTGVNMGGNGTLAFWFQEAINAVSGNLDRPGGTLVGHGILDFAAFGKKHGLLLRTDRSRIGGFQAVNDAYPGGVLADEILTPGDSRVRALIVTGGNPLITMPNAGRLREAFKKLELLVVIDIFLNETASLAHYVLPATSPLERPDLPFVFPLMLGMQARPYLQATDAIIEPDGDQRDEATIYLDLARAAGVPLFGSRAAQRVLEFSRRLSSIGGNRNGLPQKALLSLLLRITGQGSLRRLLAEPHGRLRPPYRGEDFLGRRVVTEDRKVHLAPPVLREHARRLDADFEAQLAAAGHLRLITRRAVTTHNSWTHNIEAFVAGGRSTNYLYMHREDMRRLGLRAGDIVDVSSATATVRLPLRVCDDLMPGTVALPHGWGHQHALGLNVAARTTGVNVNLLAADGPEALERVSGMARLTGISVRVRRAAGRRDTGDWSGVPQGEEDRTPDEAVLEVGTS